MFLKRKVGLAGARYRGGVPMLAWVLHRIGGIAMVLFVSLHVMASFLQYQLGSDIGTTFNIIYESIYFQVPFFFVVIFHVMNGFRVLVLDIWPKLLEYQREVTWLQWLTFIPIYGLTIFVMISRSLGGS